MPLDDRLPGLGSGWVLSQSDRAVIPTTNGQIWVVDETAGATGSAGDGSSDSAPNTDASGAYVGGALSAVELQELKSEMWPILNLDEDRVMIVDLGPIGGRGDECIEYWGAPLVEPQERAATII